VREVQISSSVILSVYEVSTFARLRENAVRSACTVDIDLLTRAVPKAEKVKILGVSVGDSM
jgi:hypothetical protein